MRHHCPDAFDTTRRQRALTLLEMLIAIALIGAILALSFPLLGSQLGERGFESMSQQVRAQLLLTRAEAMRSREALEVVFDEARSELRVRRFEPRDRDVDAREQPASLSYSWARLTLAEGMTFADAASEASEDSERIAAAMLDPEDSAGATSDSRGAPRRVVIYLGDGTALLHAALELRDEDGRRAALHINPWTGAATLERQADIATDGSVGGFDDYSLIDGPANEPATGGSR